MSGHCPAPSLRTSGWCSASPAYFIVTCLVNEQVYAAAGLDVEEAKRAARSNVHYHEMIREGSRKTVEFLDECGLIGGPSKALLRRAHVI